MISEAHINGNKNTHNEGPTDRDSQSVLFILLHGKTREPSPFEESRVYAREKACYNENIPDLRRREWRKRRKRGRRDEAVCGLPSGAAGTGGALPGRRPGGGPI